MSYLEVKRINIIRENGSKYQSNFCFHELSCSQTFQYFRGEGSSVNHIFSFIGYLEVKRGNILREDDQRINNIFAVMSYLAVKQINLIREKESKYQPQLCFNTLS